MAPPGSEKAGPTRGPAAAILPAASAPRHEAFLLLRSSVGIMALSCCSSWAPGSQPASQRQGHLLSSASHSQPLLPAHRKIRHLHTSEREICLGRSNATAFPVATSVLKMLCYLQGIKFPVQALLLPSSLPPCWVRKKTTPKIRKTIRSSFLSTYSATGPMSKFPSSVSEHLSKRLLRPSRGKSCSWRPCRHHGASGAHAEL